jgi:hypothetical protein
VLVCASTLLKIGGKRVVFDSQLAANGCSVRRNTLLAIALLLAAIAIAGTLGVMRIYGLTH